jgi:predicted nucleic acid-binding protein
MPIDEALGVYIDANILIYAMEDDGDRGLLARRWMLQADRREIRAITSELTIGEVLPNPIAERKTKLIDGYHRILRSRPELAVVPVTRAILLEASALRASLRSKLPDAIHVATARQSGCRRFLTEDTDLKVPPSMEKIALRDARFPL